MTKQKFGKKDLFTSVGQTRDTAPRPPIETSPVVVQLGDKESAFKNQGGETPPGTSSTRLITYSFRIREDLLTKLQEYAFFERIKIYQVLNQLIDGFMKDYKPRR